MTPLLRGIRVVEVGAVVLAPLAGQILGDLGADVIKVEPLSGDVARDSHPRNAGDGALFINNNRNKRMITLDLKHPLGHQALAKVIGTSDVFLHNMRIDAAKRLKLSFEDVRKINPRIVYCEAIGFGQRGQYRDRPAYDDIIQAASGLAGLSAERGGDPDFVPTIVADKVAALHVVYGILAALLARARGLEDSVRVEIPMFETMVSFVLNEHLAGATFAEVGALGYPRLMSRDRRPHPTLDGWIAVLPYTKQQWVRFLKEIGREDICQEPWFVDGRKRQSYIDHLYAIVAESLRSRTTKDWMTALSACDVPCSEVNRLQDLMSDPHLNEIGFFDVDPTFPPEIRRTLPQPVHFDGVERQPDRPPTNLGRDTRLVLLECGHDDAMIDDLIQAGVAHADEATARPSAPGRSA